MLYSQEVAPQVHLGDGPQRLKDIVEADIVRRFMHGERVLDVGIGTGRVSLPLIQAGFALTGVDTSALMLERCAKDPRARSARFVQGELQALPFAEQSFDSVVSVDTFSRSDDWATNLDELLRVTRTGGHIIVNLGSLDHINAVTRSRGRAPQLGTSDEYTVRVSSADLQAYAAQREISLVALVPYGAVFGTVIPNFWLAESYAYRSGGMDRLVSWLGADSSLFAFAQFIEQRIVAYLAPTVSDKFFAIFARKPNGTAYRPRLMSEIAARDERGSVAWRADLTAHVHHESNCTFAVALLLAALPQRLPATARAELPAVLLRELERAERATRIDDMCTTLIAAWRAAGHDLTFHGVDLADVLMRPLQREFRDRLDAKG